jgi:hypothetical protein
MMEAVFLKIKAENTGLAVATASIFNDIIRKKNNISLSSLSSVSTRAKRMIKELSFGTRYFS